MPKKVKINKIHVSLTNKKNQTKLKKNYYNKLKFINKKNKIYYILVFLI